MTALERVPDATVSTLMLLGAQLAPRCAAICRARARCSRRAGDGSFSLAERQRAEELLAEIADEAGDVDGGGAGARAGAVDRPTSSRYDDIAASE